MAERIYGSLVTDTGNALIASASFVGPKINIEAFAVGDGDGAYYLPTKDMTALKREAWRGIIHSADIDGDSPNMLNVKAVVPAGVGGFTIREAAVFTDAGAMFAISNLPDTEKVILSSGAEGEVEILMHIAISTDDIGKIEFAVDPNVITATKKDLERLIEAYASVSVSPPSGDWKVWLEDLGEVPGSASPSPP
jgi:phage-related tail fiber protein